MSMKKKSTIKEKAVPFVAGAAVTAGAVAAASLSDAKNRKKVLDSMENVKKEALTAMSNMVDTEEKMVDEVKNQVSNKKSGHKPSPVKLKSSTK